MWNQEIIDFFKTHKTKESLQEIYNKEQFDKLNDYQKLLNWYEKEKPNLPSSINNYMNFWFSNKVFKNRLKQFCESTELTEDDRTFILEFLPEDYKNYYQTLGPERCKAFGYEKNKLEKELNLLKFDKGDIKKELDFIFKEGETYLLSDIKEKLGKIYQALKFDKLPKATDLSNYYEISRKRVNQKEAFKIIKKL